MRKLIYAGALTSCAFIATAAMAADPAAPSGAAAAPASPAMKMTQAECDSLWIQANPSNAAALSQSQAQAYVSDFATADANEDGKLSQSEFAQACKQGSVKASAGAGAGAGSSGSSGTAPPSPLPKRY